MVCHIAAEFKRKTGKEILDHNNSSAVGAWQQLHRACEMAKRTLYINESASVDVEEFFEGFRLSETITRNQLVMFNSGSQEEEFKRRMATSERIQLAMFNPGPQKKTNALETAQVPVAPAPPETIPV